MGANESSSKEKESNQYRAHARQNSGPYAEPQTIHSQQQILKQQQLQLQSQPQKQPVAEKPSLLFRLSSQRGREMAFERLTVNAQEEIRLLRRASKAWREGNDLGVIESIESEIRLRLVDPASETREELEDEVKHLREQLEKSNVSRMCKANTDAFAENKVVIEHDFQQCSMPRALPNIAESA